MSWHVKPTGGYGYTTDEAKENCYEIWRVLRGRGWLLAPVCAVLGNMSEESGFNPWRWQSDTVLPSTSPYIHTQSGHAYGLVQYDPADKYIDGARGYAGYGPNFSNLQGLPTDGIAQIRFMDETSVSSGQYFQNQGYNISYEQFKKSTLEQYTMDWLTRAWFWNFERGTWLGSRTVVAQYMYDYLKTQPLPPPLHPTGTKKKLPVFMMTNRRRIKHANT